MRIGENRKTGAKPLGARTTTNNKLNPHMTLSPGIGRGAILVGGECSHHCAIPVLPVLKKKYIKENSLTDIFLVHQNTQQTPNLPEKIVQDPKAVYCAPLGEDTGELHDVGSRDHVAACLSCQSETAPRK